MESLEQIRDFEQPTDAVFDKKPITPLAIDIDVYTRLTFVDKDEIGVEWLPAGQVATLAGTYDRFVYRLVKEMGIPSEPGRIDGIDIAVLPPYTTALVKEELAWRQNWHSLPSHIMFSNIVEFIGRSAGWTRKTMDLIEARPTRSEIGSSGKVVDLYPKGVLKTLRSINMAVPMDDGWHSMHHIVDTNGADWQWVERRIRQAGFTPERRRSSLTGKILNHFPQSAMRYIEIAQKERPAPAGAWLTASALSEYANRSDNWIRRRIARYTDLAESRLDDQNVPRLHYPPHIVKELLAESSLQASLPEAGEFISFDMLCRVSGHRAKIINDLIEELGISPEPRLDKIGRIQKYYDPLNIDRINDFIESQKPSTEELLLMSTFAAGSLRARIKAIRQQLQTIKSYGDMAITSQLDEYTSKMEIYKSALKKEEQRNYKLLRKTTTGY